MDIPETEQQAVSAEQIEGVPAIRAALPSSAPTSSAWRTPWPVRR